MNATQAITNNYNLAFDLGREVNLFGYWTLLAIPAAAVLALPPRQAGEDRLDCGSGLPNQARPCPALKPLGGERAPPPALVKDRPGGPAASRRAARVLEQGGWGSQYPA